MRATVIIDRPGRDWYCPKVEFQWGEGVTSTAESDCPPYDDLAKEDQEALSTFVFTRSMRYGPGDHAISVTVSQGKNKALLTGSSLVR